MFRFFWLIPPAADSNYTAFIFIMEMAELRLPIIYREPSDKSDVLNVYMRPASINRPRANARTWKALFPCFIFHPQSYLEKPFWAAYISSHNRASIYWKERPETRLRVSVERERRTRLKVTKKCTTGTRESKVHNFFFYITEKLISSEDKLLFYI